MAQIQNFEDLIAWQKARALTRAIYSVTREAPFMKDFALAAQIQRASVSIMSNIAEGFERTGLKEFHKFLSIAKSSCAEVRSHLYIAFDIGYLLKSTFEKLYAQAHEVGRIIGGLRSSVRKKMSQE